MKKFFAIMLTLAAMASAPVASANPDITDLLKGALGGAQSGSGTSYNGTSTALSGLQGLVEGLISKSNLTEADLVGSWVYNGPAVAFQSDDLLKKAGGAAASGVIVDKLAPYYEKTGINNLTAIFKNDGTFKFQLKRSALSGEYAKDPDSPDGDFIFQFSIKGKMPVGKVSAHVEKVGNKLTITFDASKLITIVNSIASISGQSTLKSVASLLNSYDGLKCGFELKKQ